MSSTSDLQSRYDRPAFPGETFDHDLDYDRLKRHMQRVVDALKGGRRHTLKTLATEVGCSEASASARLRQLRNEYGWPIEKARVDGGGLWEYWCDAAGEVTE